MKAFMEVEIEVRDRPEYSSFPQIRDEVVVDMSTEKIEEFKAEVCRRIDLAWENMLARAQSPAEFVKSEPKPFDDPTEDELDGM